MDQDTRDAIRSSIEKLDELLGKLPSGAARSIREKLAILRALLIDQRHPQLVLIGRRGAGKSSLINALMGEQVAALGHVKSATGKGKWWDYESSQGAFSILDTRGIQEGSQPDEADDHKDPAASILSSLSERPADAVLFLVKATEVDAAIDGDLDVLEKILNEVEKSHGYRPPLVGVLTQCDTLEPKNVKLHEPEEEDEDEVDEKLERIRQAEQHLARKLHGRRSLRDSVVTTIGVSAYMSWKKDGTLRYDERWRIEKLVEWLCKELPKEALVELARVTRVKAVQNMVATILTNTVGAICGALALNPIPLSDIAPITALQVSLIAGIAWISGRDVSMKAAGEFLVAIGANVGLAFGLRELARLLGNVVFVGAGSMVSAVVAYAGTVAIGMAAAAYFIDGVSKSDAKKVFSSSQKTAATTLPAFLKRKK